MRIRESALLRADGVAVLLGPNGCGKSNTLDRIARLKTGSEPGLVYVDDDGAPDTLAAAVESLGGHIDDGQRADDAGHLDSGYIPGIEPHVGGLGLYAADGLLDLGLPTSTLPSFWDALGLPRIVHIDAISNNHDVDRAVGGVLVRALQGRAYVDDEELLTTDINSVSQVRELLIAHLTTVLNTRLPEFLTARGRLRIVITREPGRPVRVVTRHAGGDSTLASAVWDCAGGRPSSP